MDNQKTPAEYKDKFMLIFVGEFWSDDPIYETWVEGRIEIRKWEDNYSNDEIHFCTPQTNEWWAFQEKYSAKWLTASELEDLKKTESGIYTFIDWIKNANLKYYEMGVTVLQVAKMAWRIYINRDKEEMVDDKRLLLSLLFSNATLNGKIAEVSFHKAFKIIFDHVGDLMGEKIDQKKIFEQLKSPKIKRKAELLALLIPYGSER